MRAGFINGFGSELPERRAARIKETAADGATEATPAVRPEKIARARALLAGDDYPSAKILWQLAGCLAGKI